MYAAFMDTTPETIADLIARFEKIAIFADEIGCGYEAARQMRNRGSIAVKHWPSVVAAAERRGIPGVTVEWLAAKAAETAQAAS